MGWRYVILYDIFNITCKGETYLNNFFNKNSVVIPSLGLLTSVTLAINSTGTYSFNCTFVTTQDDEIIKSLGLDELLILLDTAGLEGTKLAFYLGQLTSEEDPLIGTKEFAEILGWNQARLSTLYRRQCAGSNVVHPLPKPMANLASTPVWRKSQAIIYKEQLIKEKL